MAVRPGPWLSPAVMTRSDTPGSLLSASGRVLSGERGQPVRPMAPRPRERSDTSPKPAASETDFVMRARPALRAAWSSSDDFGLWILMRSSWKPDPVETPVASTVSKNSVSPAFRCSCLAVLGGRMAFAVALRLDRRVEQEHRRLAAVGEPEVDDQRRLGGRAARRDASAWTSTTARRRSARAASRPGRSSGPRAPGSDRPGSACRRRALEPLDGSWAGVDVSVGVVSVFGTACRLDLLDLRGLLRRLEDVVLVAERLALLLRGRVLERDDRLGRRATP